MTATIKAEVGAKSAGRTRAPASRPKTPKQARPIRSARTSSNAAASVELPAVDVIPMAAPPPNVQPTNDPTTAPQATSKTARLLVLLSREGGATIADLCEATGWQQHSVRGAMAGALKKKGHVVTSTKQDGVRRYQLGAAS